MFSSWSLVCISVPEYANSSFHQMGRLHVTRFFSLLLQEVSEPTKEEKAVAKYLRFNCPTKSTNMMGHRVDYFIG